MKKKAIYLNILLLLLLLGFCGTSYAFTWDEFTSFYNMIDTHTYYNANTKNALKYFHDNADNVKTYISSQGYNLDNYNTFLVQYSSSSVPRYLYFCNVNDNCTWSKNGWDKITATFSGVEVVYFKFWSDNSITKGTETWSNKALSNITGLIGIEPTSTLDTQVAFQNYLKDININRTYFSNTDSLQYFADAIVGNQQITDRITYQLFSSSGDFVEYLGTDTTEVTTHRIYQLYINTFDPLINNGWYYIKVYNGDNYLFESEDFQISWFVSPYVSPGTITNNSGEVTGNINLDEINNNLITIIDILSGDIVTAVDNQGNVITGSLSQLQQAINDTNNSLNDIKNGLFGGSGDSGEGILGGTTLESGEEPTIEDLPTIDVEDPSNDFFTWLLQEIERILNDNNDVTLTIPIYKTNYYIRSDVFKLSIEPLRTFIQAGWWFIVGVPFLKYIRRSVEKLKGGEIPASDDKSDLLGNIL